jgi:hypothetical protein
MRDHLEDLQVEGVKIRIRLTQVRYSGAPFEHSTES